MTHTISLSDVASGACRLRWSTEGGLEGVVTVVDLDGVDDSWIAPALDELSTSQHGIVLGRASEPLDASLSELSTALTLVSAPGGPRRVWGDRPLDSLLTTIEKAPHAVLTLDGLLRATSTLGVVDGPMAESLAYSMLQSGAAFVHWHDATASRDTQPPADPAIVTLHEDVLTVTLNRPERHYAFGRSMREGLLEALELAELAASITAVHLRGAGPSCCSGGDLDEFGTASSPVPAHAVRLVGSAALRVHRLRDKVLPELHGACIGAGIEIPSFAAHLVAHDDAYFALPEVGLGLVPGAGGTVGVTRRIGRWRTAWLALSGEPLDASTALEWGLVDELWEEPANGPG